MAKRVVLRIVPAKVGGWLLEGKLPYPSAGPHWSQSKPRLVARGRAAGRTWWSRGQTAQLVVHGRDGRIRFENTYGRDPVRRKG